MRIRGVLPEDYDRVICLVDGWWGRPVSQALPRVFFDHFFATSRIAEDEQGVAGFLVAFVSPAQPSVAYAHFVGVRPDCRRNGLARTLYEEFAACARAQGCREMRAITAPENEASVRFHVGLGFTVSSPVPDYNGPGRAMVVFRRSLGFEG
jgi:ribosomal protein S18 acetylase RimI-like enzyme